MKSDSDSASFVSELRGHFALAVPLAAGHLGQHLLSAVNAAMLGRYSEAALAGSGIGATFYFTVAVIGVGIILGLETIIPQAFGAGDVETAARSYRSGLLLGGIVGVALAGLSIASIGALDLIGTTPDVRREAAAYLITRTPAVIPFLITVAARSYLQALGRIRPIVIATIVGNLINVVLNWLLIFGDTGLRELGAPGLGIPELGVVGAGISSVAVTIVMTAIIVAATPAPRGPVWDRHANRKIIAYGLPVGLQLSLEVGIFAIASALASTLGAIAAAAHQIAVTLASLSFALALALGGSSATRVGHAVGSNDWPRARASGFAGLSIGATSMAGFGIVFLLIPREIASLFTNNAAVLDAATPLLRIAAFFQLSDAAQAIMAGSLRGAGDTRSTFVGNLIGHYCLGLPIMIILGIHLDWGTEGVWWGLSGGLTATAIALTLRFWYWTAKHLE